MRRRSRRPVSLLSGDGSPPSDAPSRSLVDDVKRLGWGEGLGRGDEDDREVDEDEGRGGRWRASLDQLGRPNCRRTR